MGENSKIEWTHHTFNPWAGCQKVSAACEYCYAEDWAKRFGKPELWKGERQRTSDANWKLPYKWNRQAAKDGTRLRVFCASLADVFEDRGELAGARSDLFNVINETPCLDWLLLTKRPENVENLWPWGWYDEHYTWDNVWIGTTVENQEMADKRIPALLQIPAKVRFLSIEPMLGPIDLWGARYDLANGQKCSAFNWGKGVNWVIAGGESGTLARQSDADWFRAIRDECNAAGVPFHFKQWGEWLYGRRVGKKNAGRILDARTWDELPTGGAHGR